MKVTTEDGPGVVISSGPTNLGLIYTIRLDHPHHENDSRWRVYRAADVKPGG